MREGFHIRVFRDSEAKIHLGICGWDLQTISGGFHFVSGNSAPCRTGCFENTIVRLDVHLVRGGSSFVSGDGNLRLIQQRQKFIFFPAGNVNMVIVSQYNISAFAFNVFLDVPEVDEIGMVHPAKS